MVRGFVWDGKTEAPIFVFHPRLRFSRISGWEIDGKGDGGGGFSTGCREMMRMMMMMMMKRPYRYTYLNRIC